MSDETEYAMKFANERRMRINLETRLHGLMYTLVPYVSESLNMCHAFIDKNSDDIASSMAHLVEWQGNVETNLMLNLFRPAGTLQGFSDDELSRCGGLADLPDSELTRIELATKACAEETEKQWDKLAAEFGGRTRIG
jgi:hypothetical protein